MNDDRIDALLDDVVSEWSVEHPPEDFAARVVESEEPPMQIATPSPPTSNRWRPWIVPSIVALAAAAAVWLWQRPTRDATEPPAATPALQSTPKQPEPVIAAEAEPPPVPREAPEQPDDDSAKLREALAARENATDWCIDVESAFTRGLADGYPFNPDGDPVALADLTDLYHPEEGQVWKYYAQELETAVSRTGNVYEFAGRGAASNPYRPEVADFLSASRQITESMFPRGAADPTVEFNIRIKSSSGIKEVSLTVDGQTVSYRGGATKWVEMTWPGEDAPGARLEVIGLTRKDALEFYGEWGLFQLLEAAKVGRTTSGKRGFTAQWEFAEEDLGIVQITFEAQRFDTPFFGVGGQRSFMSIFRSDDVRPPRSIALSAPPCPALDE